MDLKKRNEVETIHYSGKKTLRPVRKVNSDSSDDDSEDSDSDTDDDNDKNDDTR